MTKAFHNFMTLIWAMAPHFQVGRFAYFPHDVYGGREVVDRRPWRVDVLMNTTRMGARGRKRAEDTRKTGEVTVRGDVITLRSERPRPLLLRCTGRELTPDAGH